MILFVRFFSASLSALLLLANSKTKKASSRKQWWQTNAKTRTKKNAKREVPGIQSINITHQKNLSAIANRTTGNGARSVCGTYEL